MTNTSPSVKALNAASRAIGYKDWDYVPRISDSVIKSVVAHAYTLDELWTYTGPPVDADELARRKLAREMAAAVATDIWEEILAGKEDDLWAVQSAYHLACYKDGVQPTPWEAWS
jgi:hypothetical protein